MPGGRVGVRRKPQREQGSWTTPGAKQGEVFADQRFYDLGIRFVVPRYEELHEAILSALDVPHEAPFEAIDLGVGTGELSIKILRRWPNARILGVDQSGDMLEVAKRKLSGYPERMRFEQLSMTRMKKRGAAFDAVVSCLSVHHLTGPEKAKLFKV
ncbi:MAG: class I SAM-dependent methyltransferase, partial [bacterium]